MDFLCFQEKQILLHPHSHQLATFSKEINYSKEREVFDFKHKKEKEARLVTALKCSNHQYYYLSSQVSNTSQLFSIMDGC
jgi:hypothetical protein